MALSSPMRLTCRTAGAAFQVSRVVAGIAIESTATLTVRSARIGIEVARAASGKAIGAATSTAGVAKKAAVTGIRLTGRVLTQRAG